MRTKIYLLLIALVATIGSVWGQGQSFTYGGLNYSVTDVAGRIVEVARGNYSGDIVIPSTVPFGNDTYKVESIVDYAFSRSQGLRSVVISEGIKSIGEYAFAMDSSLVSVTIKTTDLTTIPHRAFYGCVALAEITIPEGVQSLGVDAFLGCPGLVTVNLPSTLQTIGNNALSGGDIVESYNIHEDNTNFKSIDGVLYNFAMTTLIAYPNGSKNTSLTIPNSVTVLSGNIFMRALNLTDFLVDVTHPTFSSVGGVLFNKVGDVLIYCPAGKVGEYKIPDGVTTITERAFIGTALTKIVIPTSVTSINMHETFNFATELVEFEVALGNGQYKSEAGVLFSEDMTILVAYPNARPDEDYVVPTSVTTIGTRAFNHSLYIKNIKLHDGITTIEHTAFLLSWSLESINLPNAVTAFERYSLASCYELKSIILPDNMTSIPLAFLRYSRSLTSVEIPQNVTSIGDQAFQYSGVKNVTLPDNLLTIGSNAFDDAHLASVVIPESVTSIGANAFANNLDLKEVIFLGDTPPATISSDAFYGIAEDAYLIVPQGSEALYEAWVDANSLSFTAAYEATTVVVNPATGVKFIDDETGEVLSELPQAATGKEYTILPEDDEKNEVESVTVGGSTITKGTDGEFHVLLDGDKTIEVVVVPKKVVTFINDGSTVHTQYVKNGALATSYSSISKSGHNLRGWNVGSSTTLYNFSTPVTADLTLTASWAEIPATFTVTITPLSGVTVNKTGETVDAGRSFSFTAEARSGYSVIVSVNGTTLPAISGITYLIEDIRENKTVTFRLVAGSIAPPNPGPGDGTTPPPAPEVGIPGPGEPGGPGQVIIDGNTPSDLGKLPGDGQIIVRPPLVDPNSPTPPKVIIDGKEVEGEWKTDEDGNPVFVIDLDGLEDGKHTIIINDKEFEFTVDKNARPTSNDVLSTATVTAGYGSVTIETPNAATVQVVSFSGSVVYNAKVTGTTTVNVPAGIYAVVVDGTVTKVVVR